MSEKRVSVGFIGVGNRSVVEMLDLAMMPDVDVVALCDIAPERIQQTVDRVDARVGPARSLAAAERFADYREMLRNKKLDAVYVALPPFAHGEVEHAVLDAGKAICVEKPVALTPDVAHGIERHVLSSGVVSAVAYQLRYGSHLQKAREILAGRQIGLVVAPRLGQAGGSWWQVQSRSGGMLVEQHTHSVDLMRYIAGEAESIYAQAGTVLLTDVPGLTIHDVNSATVRFKSGAVGSIVNSCAVPQSAHVPLGLMVHFVARDVTVSYSFGETVAAWTDGRREVFADDGQSNFRMNRAFMDAVKTGDRSGILSPYSDAVKTFELTYAGLVSAQRNEVVRLG
jgi:myo-inositol 2-dehydrogenase / D-chiro-inositol 1-dehydrogenase